MADPRYKQIADELQELIDEGELQAGALLPSEAKLREKYNASRNTVRDAVKLLESRGKVIIRRGQGSFVADRDVFITTLTPFDTVDKKGGVGMEIDVDRNFGGGEGRAYEQEVAAQGRTAEASKPKVGITSASNTQAEMLEVRPGDPLVSRSQERFIDDSPYSLQTSFYPMRLVEEGAQKLLSPEDIPEGVVNYLRETIRLKQAGYRDLISARWPKDDELAFFDLSAKSSLAVIETFRTAYDADGRAFRLVVTVFAADRNRFRIFGGDVPDRIRTPRSKE